MCVCVCGCQFLHFVNPGYVLHGPLHSQLFNYHNHLNHHTNHHTTQHSNFKQLINYTLKMLKNY